MSFPTLFSIQFFMYKALFIACGLTGPDRVCMYVHVYLYLILLTGFQCDQISDIDGAKGRAGH